MPRSCSTLLQNILGQGSDIHATPTDGSLELLYAARAQYTTSPEFKATNCENAWKAFCKGGLESYASALSDKEHTCIKSRGIGIHYPWYSWFMEEPVKIICMVRDIRSIFASMEKLYRANPEQHQPIQNHAEMSGTTVEKRVDIWLNSQPIGLALERFKEMGIQNISDHCLYVRAEDLCSDPTAQMKRIYDYLEIPEVVHDFKNIEQVTIEDDSVYGLTPDLHNINKEVTPLVEDYNEILGESLAAQIHQHCVGYQTSFGYSV